MEPHEYQGQSETSEHRKLYVSGEVILYSAHDLARMTGWSLGTIYRLFDDPDIPVIDYGKGKLVENHALMQFFSSRRDEVNLLDKIREKISPYIQVSQKHFLCTKTDGLITDNVSQTFGLVTELEQRSDLDGMIDKIKTLF